jgi:plasmid stabilization system protein ParE
MNLPLLIQQDAQLDFEEAIQYYENQRQGLGLEFLEEVQATLQLISTSPLIHQKVFHRIHKCLVGRRFPYLIYYEPVDFFIAVYAVWHTSRNPDELLRRF